MAVGASAAMSQQAKTGAYSSPPNLDGLVLDAPFLEELRQQHFWVCSIESIDCPLAPRWNGCVDILLVGLRSSGAQRPWGLPRGSAAQELCLWACEHHVYGAVLHQPDYRPRQARSRGGCWGCPSLSGKEKLASIMMDVP